MGKNPLVRRLTAGACAAVLTATALAACGGGGTAAKSDGTLKVIGFPPTPTFVDDYNPGAPPTGQGPLLNMMYEPLVRVDDNHMTIEPYLAQAWQWSADAKTLTMNLRANAKWSDGQPLTSDDVRYTFVDLPKKYPSLPFLVPTFASLDTPDPHTVVFHFARPSRVMLADWSWTGGLIVPKHVFEKQDLGTWTNPNPVTTGPFTVDRFTPQQITLKARSDWWGGPSKGVKTVKVLAAGSPEATQSALIRGDADWANIPWTGADTQWETTSKRKFWQASNAYRMVAFNMDRAPYGDVHVRRALYDAFDSTKLTQVLHNGAKPVNITGMDAKVFGDTVAPEFRNRLQAPDAAAAKSELAAGGYTVAGGELVKGGTHYRFTLNGQDVAVPEMRVLAAQWKTALGLDVVVKQEGTSFTDAIKKGDYGLYLWQGGGCGVYCNFNALNSELALPLGKAAADNFGRIRDPQLDGLLKRLSAATTEQGIQQIGWDVQRRFVDQRFNIPLEASGASAVVNSAHWLFPKQGESNAFPGLGLAAEPAVTIMNLRPAK